MLCYGMSITLCHADENGSPMPFWIKFDHMSMPEDNRCRSIVSNVLGKGSFLPDPDAVWMYKFRAGYLVMMFRTEEDQMLARMVLD